MTIEPKTLAAMIIHVSRTLFELGNYYNWWTINSLNSSSEYWCSNSVSSKVPINLACLKESLIVAWDSKLMTIEPKTLAAMIIHVSRTLFELGNYYNWWTINSLNSSSEYWCSNSVSSKVPINLACLKESLIVAWDSKLTSVIKITKW